MPTPRFRLPQLKLRGKIIAAAALVFTVAIAASLLFVLTSSRQKDLATAGREIQALAESRSDDIRLRIDQYSTIARATANAAEAIIANPAAALSLMGDIVMKQARMVPDSLGVIVMLTPAAGIAGRPDFTASGFGYQDQYFGAYAQLPGGGKEPVFGTLEDKTGAGYAWIGDDMAHEADVVGPNDYSGVLYTSVTSVIHDGSGKPVGVAIVAFDAKQLSTLIGGEAPMGSGFAGVINNDGIWVMNPDPEVLGKKAEDAWVTDTVKALGDKEFYQSSGPAPDGAVWSLTAQRIPLAGTERDWTVLVSVPQDSLLTASNQQLTTFFYGGIGLLVLGLVAFFFVGNSIAGPVIRMTAVMRRIADADHSVEVPYATRRDEIGDMAEAVTVFRENGRKVSEMTEAEAARVIRDQEARGNMMSQLRQAFGNVVDAAVGGDFSKRVETEFPDDELNAIAASINNLVETVDRGLGETGEVLAALADTNLTKRVEGTYAGAFNRLKTDTNKVAERLGEIVGRLKSTSGTLKLATSEILSGANDLSERTTRQASTIQETSSAMERLAETVAENAKRANEATGVAATVTRTAEEGGQVMGAANDAMARITASSAKISNIIGLIDDIAFQTNLLALNASVEAARAGDAGKGFAVVAVEVRRLAQSAASASAEVKVLIEQSGTEVSGGSKLVADAASKLSAMLTAARSSSALMDGIARQSQEQASAIEEVTTAVRQMDEMTQHNAALVEQINASIEQTESQATDLDRIVDVFTVSDGTGREAATQVPSRPPAAQPEGARAGTIKAIQNRVKQAAKSYLSRGGAAVDADWSEF
jgi:methyl-accepting chemotaxis protein